MRRLSFWLRSPYLLTAVLLLEIARMGVRLSEPNWYVFACFLLAAAFLVLCVWDGNINAAKAKRPAKQE